VNFRLGARLGWGEELCGFRSGVSLVIEAGGAVVATVQGPILSLT
jgi:hypothetical protein